MTTKTIPTIQPIDGVLAGDQARQFFDRQVRLLLNMSGEEFLRRWDAGEYHDLPDTPETRNIMWVEDLIPFGRPDS